MRETTQRRVSIASRTDTDIDEAQTTAEAGQQPAHTESLSIEVPNSRDDEQLCAFVEAALVELTHEDVGLIHEPGAVADSDRLEVVCADETGQTFEFRRYVARHGWDVESVSREAAREKLQTLVAHDGDDTAAREQRPDRVSVRPAAQLQSRCVEVGR
jgi:hypothetical protein